MDAGLLDTLVKLAALGAAGVCIFAIFWIGWLILRLPEGATQERHKTLRMFMIITVLIALISGAAGFVNAKFNADEISTLKDDATTLASDFDKHKEESAQTISQYKERESDTKNAIQSIKSVVKAKELSNPSAAIQIHINVLKEFIARAESDEN